MILFFMKDFEHHIDCGLYNSFTEINKKVKWIYN